MLGAFLDALFQFDLEIVFHEAGIDHARRMTRGDTDGNGLRIRRGGGSHDRTGDNGCCRKAGDEF